jgi:Zn-finger protein
MPISPQNKARYPKDWPQIRERIRARAGDKCEQCGVPNHVYRNKSTGEWTRNEMQVETWTCVDGDKVTRIVCTTAHLDHIPEHCSDENLRFMCQKCHLAYDHEHHQKNSRNTRRAGKVIAELF